MKEQKGNEKNEKNEKKKKRMSKEKRFYLFTAVGSASALLAIILVAVLVTNLSNVNKPTAGNINSSIQNPSDSGSGDVGDGDDGDNEPVITTPEGMIMPMESVSVSNDYGLYHNVTLNKYYEHRGVDFTAEAGTEVLAAEDGVIESIYRNDTLTGTEITVDHGDGVKTVYRFVEAAENLSVGKEVKKGEVIATVAEATGEEYKDGAHLHFEIVKNGKSVDPATYLTFEEK